MNRSIIGLLVLGYIPLSIGLIVCIVMLVRKGYLRTRCAQKPVYPIRGEDEGSSVLEDEGTGHEYDFETLKNRICVLMEKEKLYLNPDIRVTDLAERLYTNKNYVAHALKSRMNRNFCQMVHYYRIQEAMRIYAQNPHISMRELARRVGFNSMTTFNGAFSRHTGYTPAEWCKHFKKSNELEVKDA